MRLCIFLALIRSAVRYTTALCNLTHTNNNNYDNSNNHQKKALVSNWIRTKKKCGSVYLYINVHYVYQRHLTI